MTSIDRILRKSLKGPTHTAERKEFRYLAANEDFTTLRQIAGFDNGILAQTARDIIHELERSAADRARTLATNAEIVKAQTCGCPCCGATIRRNSSLSGWWQCSQFGAEGFRADASKPPCSWQLFFVRVE
jgi:hypothetical protein